MISNTTIVTCLITFILCTLVPPTISLIFARNNKGSKIVSAWLLGAAGFFVTQFLIRVPILTALQFQPWFVSFSQNHLFGYAFTLAFTAGLFELAGRFLVAKLMRRNLNYKRSFAAGLGHGSIEAMLLVGTTYLNNIIYIFMINSGTFDTLVAQAAATGMDVSSLWQIKDTLLQASPLLFLLASYERALAMTAHLAMSLIVCYGIHCGKPVKSALLCLGIHTLLDLTAGISMISGTALSQTAAYVMIYTILTIMAVLSILIIRNIRRRWQETEVAHV